MYLFRSNATETDQKETVNDDKVIIKEGKLKKEGNWVKSWKERYFKLENDSFLSYYNDQSDTEALGRIDLSPLISMSQLSLPEEEKEDESEILFALELPNRIWRFKAKNQVEVHEWFQAIQIAQQYNLNSKEDLDKILSETKPQPEPLTATPLFLNSNFESERNIEGENNAKRTLQSCTLTKWVQWKLNSIQGNERAIVRDLSQLSDGVILLKILLKKLEDRRMKRKSCEISDEENENEEKEKERLGSYSLTPHSMMEKIQNFNFIAWNLREMRPSTFKPLPSIAIQSIVTNGNAKSMLDFLWMFFYVLYVEQQNYQGFRGKEAVFRWFLERAEKGNGGEIHLEDRSFHETFVDGMMLWSVVNSYAEEESSSSTNRNHSLNLGGVLKMGEEKFRVPKLFGVEELMLTPNEENSMFVYLVSLFETFEHK
eukprot:TRINITY_DN764_c0_g1_i15.p1 TRINITY_DN764_c0_g1~~TRINITY_DN764_c0_g1_i15.p1  ORF type:complete len:428 (+),score=151.98 TRINITY_DN764_c0_g1_i15:130-1413(+)